VPVTKEATLNDVDAPPGLPPALATAPHLHIANRVSLGPRAGYAPFTGAAAEGDVILSVDSGSRMACFDALCDIQPLCVHLDLGYGTSNSIFGRFCEREGMDHDTVGPAGGVFRAVKSCKLAFVHGQMLGRRLVYARSDPCFGKLDERVYSAVALYVECGFYTPFGADTTGFVETGFTAQQRARPEGSAVFVKGGTLLRDVQQRDDDNDNDDPGFDFWADISGIRLHLTVSHARIRRPYKFDYARVVQFLRCSFTGESQPRELALVLPYVSTHQSCGLTYGEIVTTPDPAAALRLVDVATIDHVAHLMPRWAYRTATLAGHSKEWRR